MSSLPRCFLRLPSARPLSLRRPFSLSTSPDAGTPYAVRIAAAWQGKPAEPEEPARKRRRPTPAALRPGSPIGVYRDDLVASLAPTRHMGEDSFFATELANRSGVAFGVADGVGGWVEQGVDPSIFATSLMMHARELASLPDTSPGASPGSPIEPWNLLPQAYQRVLGDEDVLAGSSTAVIVVIDANTARLSVANLGDSIFYLIRDSRCLFAQPPQTRDFNFPLQLAKNGGSESAADDPGQADRTTGQLQHGDLGPCPTSAAQCQDSGRVIVIAATDGFSDNVHVEEVEAIVAKYNARLADDERALPQLALALIDHARTCSCSTDKRTPFQVDAARYGFRAPGGKVDDITVVVSRIEERSQAAGGPALRAVL